MLIIGSVILRFRRVTFVCRTFYYFEFITPWKLREGKIESHFNWNFSCSDIDIVARFLHVTPWCFIFAFSPARTNLYGSLPILIWAHFDWVSHKSQVTTAGQNKRKNFGPFRLSFAKPKKNKLQQLVRTKKTVVKNSLHRLLVTSFVSTKTCAKHNKSPGPGRSERNPDVSFITLNFKYFV